MNTRSKCRIKFSVSRRAGYGSQPPSQTSDFETPGWLTLVQEGTIYRNVDMLH